MLSGPGRLGTIRTSPRPTPGGWAVAAKQTILKGAAKRRLGARALRHAAPRLGAYSTVTDLARLRGWSTSVPLSTAT